MKRHSANDDEEMLRLIDSNDMFFDFDRAKALSETKVQVFKEWFVESSVVLPDVSRSYLFLHCSAETISGKKLKTDSFWSLIGANGRIDHIHERIAAELVGPNDPHSYAIGLHNLSKYLGFPKILQIILTTYKAGIASTTSIVKVQLGIGIDFIMDFICHQSSAPKHLLKNDNCSRCIIFDIFLNIYRKPIAINNAIHSNCSSSPEIDDRNKLEIELWDWQKRNVNFICSIENDPDNQNLIVNTYDGSIQIGETNICYNRIYDRFEINTCYLDKNVETLKTIQCRGGLICDPPSSGKTLTMVAAIWIQKLNYSSIHDNFKLMPKEKKSNFFQSKATVIFVPNRLVDQWVKQFQFGLGSRCLKYSKTPNKKNNEETGTNATKLVYLPVSDYGKWKTLSLQTIMNEIDVFIFPINFLLGKTYCRHRSVYKSSKGEETYSQDWSPSSMLQVCKDVQRMRMDLVEKTVTADELTQIPIEAIFWQRKIIDEAHELDFMAKRSRNPFCYVECNSTWLLTATPKLSAMVNKEEGKTSSILELKVLDKNNNLEDVSSFKNADENFLNAILTSWCRKSGKIDKQPLVEEIVPVTFSRQEMAFYSSQSNSEKALMFCSFHNHDCADTSNSKGELMTMDQLVHQSNDESKAKIAELNEKIEFFRSRNIRKRNKLQQFLLNNHTGLDPEFVQSTFALDFKISLLKNVLPETHALSYKLQEKCDKIHKCESNLKSFEGRLVTIDRQLKYYDSVMKLLLDKDDIECPIHSGPVDLKATAVLTCGHVFCDECIKMCCNNSDVVKCPMCRAPINLKKDVRVVNREPYSTENPAADDKSISSLYGSKIEVLVNLIQKIRSDPSQGKILVFAKWDNLLLQLASVLTKLKIGNALPRGRIGTINAEFQKFYDDPDVPVLLLSSKNNLSGSHLIAANNLVFVNPFTEASKTSLDQWEQAVSRMQRYGQTRPLKVWYLSTIGTVESKMTEKFMKFKTTATTAAAQSPVVI